jgi:transcriptional regulator GlxA family with amidase domain
MAKQPIRVRILLYENAAISLALFTQDILQRVNMLLGSPCFETSFAGRPGLTAVTVGPISIRLPRSAAPADHLVVPPLAFGSDPFAERPGEWRTIENAHRRGAIVHTACHGALVVARTGLLDGRTATTHWNWIQRAAQRFPSVHWDGSRMICDAGDVVTAGGFLAFVDLILALVERTCGRTVSRELGRLILADSTRQRQSVYATTLVSRRVEDRGLQRLEEWLHDRLSTPVTVVEMAKFCNRSVRSFHREFAAAYGVTPRKYVQLKRIEAVRKILRNPTISVEEAIQRVGVADVPSFRKVFQRELGMSPAEFRRKLQAG